MVGVVGGGAASSAHHTALCPCSNVQAMRRAHLLDGAVVFSSVVSLVFLNSKLLSRWFRVGLWIIRWRGGGPDEWVRVCARESLRRDSDSKLSKACHQGASTTPISKARHQDGMDIYVYVHGLGIVRPAGRCRATVALLYSCSACPALFCCTVTFLHCLHWGHLLQLGERGMLRVNEARDSVTPTNTIEHSESRAIRSSWLRLETRSARSSAPSCDLYGMYRGTPRTNNPARNR